MESIKDKLRKIKALVDRGVDGEAKAAQYQLEKLLSKYNISIEDLFGETLKERKFKVKKDEEQIFIQVVLSIIGNRAKEVFHYLEKRSEKYANLTDAEYIDISQQFDFHRVQLAKERKNTLSQLEMAYVHKHNLFNKDASFTDHELKQRESKITWEEYKRIMALKDSLEDVTFHKQLGK